MSSPSAVRTAASSPRSGEDKTIHVREAATGRELLGLRGHTGAVTCLAFSPDGQRLVSAGKDGTIRVWDGTPLRGDEGREEGRSFSHHTNEVWSLAVRPTDGRMIVSGGFKTPASVWDAQSGAMSRRKFPASRRSSSVSPGHPTVTGRLRRRGGRDSSTSRSSTRGTGRRTSSLRTSRSSWPWRFTRTAKHLVTGQQDGTIRFWDADTGRELGMLGNHGNPLRGVAFSRDGRHLASASVSGDIKLWDAIRLDEQHLDGKAKSPRALDAGISPGVCLNLAFSPDGRFLASGGEGYTVRIFDVETGKEARPPLRGHKEDIYAVAFSPDGRWLASAGEDSTVRIWDRNADYALVRTFHGHNGLVNSLEFSPDSQKLFSGSNDYTVMVWDMTQLYDRPGR